MQLRGNIYYFRWRIPADLRPILGLTELKYLLCTVDQLQATVRAGRVALVVADIQLLRQAHLALELNFDEYVSALKQYWKRVYDCVRACVATDRTQKFWAVWAR